MTIHVTLLYFLLVINLSSLPLFYIILLKDHLRSGFVKLDRQQIQMA